MIQFFLEAYDFFLPILPLYLATGLLTALAILLILKFYEHVDGLPLLRTVGWSFILPPLYLLKICLHRVLIFFRLFISRDRRESMLGSLFGVSSAKAARFFWLFVTIGCGCFYGLKQYELDPVRMETRIRLARHGNLNKEQYFAALTDGLMTRLEGKYNVGIIYPDRQWHETRFQIRTFDGRVKVDGDIDSAFRETRRLSPTEAIDYLVRIMGILDGSVTLPREQAEKELKRYEPPHPPNSYGRWVSYSVENVPQPIRDFSEKVIPPMLPDAATLAQLINMKPARVDDLTSSIVTKNPAAWDLALNEQDLAAYEARQDPQRSKRVDNRSTTMSIARDSARLWTRLEQTLPSAYGDLAIILEVTQDPRTAAASLYYNKLMFPGQDKDIVGVILPQLTQGGHQYVALLDHSAKTDPRYTLWMEGYYRNAWYRIGAPAQAAPARNADLFRLLNMQKNKVARLLGAAAE